MFHEQDITNQADLDKWILDQRELYPLTAFSRQIFSLTFRSQQQFEGEIKTKQLTHIILKSLYL